VPPRARLRLLSAAVEVVYDGTYTTNRAYATLTPNGQAVDTVDSCINGTDLGIGHSNDFYLMSR